MEREIYKVIYCPKCKKYHYLSDCGFVAITNCPKCNTQRIRANLEYWMHQARGGNWITKKFICDPKTNKVLHKF